MEGTGDVHESFDHMNNRLQNPDKNISIARIERISLDRPKTDASNTVLRACYFMFRKSQKEPLGGKKSGKPAAESSSVDAVVIEGSTTTASSTASRTQIQPKIPFTS